MLSAWSNAGRDSARSETLPVGDGGRAHPRHRPSDWHSQPGARNHPRSRIRTARHSKRPRPSDIQFFGARAIDELGVRHGHIRPPTTRAETRQQQATTQPRTILENRMGDGESGCLAARQPDLAGRLPLSLAMVLKIIAICPQNSVKAAHISVRASTPC